MAELTLQPDFTYEPEDQFVTLVSTFENKAEQRRAKRSTARVGFSLMYINRSKVDYETMRAFFNARKGAYEAFDWTCKIDGVKRSVRFASDKLKYLWKSYNSYNWAFDLITV